MRNRSNHRVCMEAMKVLSDAQLRRLNEHKYSAQGVSLLEPLFQPFWRWLVTTVPLWLAPNLITFVGLVVNVATSLLVVLSDLNNEGKASGWMYVACALGIFVYQSLDAIDGKQARRTHSNNQLGELFDHGCDAISIFLLVMVNLSATGMVDMPYTSLLFVLVLLSLSYLYHWQAYVHGTLHFHIVDVTEAQLFSMLIFICTGLFGSEMWRLQIPVGEGVMLKNILALGTLSFTAWNIVRALQIILDGKKSIAGSSIYTPLLPLLTFAAPVVCYAASSSKILHSHALIFHSAFSMPITKLTIKIMIAVMTKTPLAALDSIMLGPGLALLNLYLGTPLPELYLLTGIAVFNVTSVLVLCVVVCVQVCQHLNIHCFTIPYPPPSPPPPPPSSSKTQTSDSKK